MKLLSLESSAKAASAALTEDGRLIAQYYQNCGLTHSRTLLPLTAALLENCGLRPEEVDALAVAAGPGSFTGVRIGISTVKGLALGWDRPCFAVSTLESMAQPLLPGSSLICAVMDARAGQVYNALFDWEDGLRRLGKTYTLLGPAPAAVAKVNNRYRYRLTLMGKNGPDLRRLVAHLLRAVHQDKENRGITVYADTNPMD